MEFLAPAFGCDIFMDNNYRSFRLLTHIGVNIWATELDYANALSLGETAAKKKAFLSSVHQIKSSVFLTVVG